MDCSEHLIVIVLPFGRCLVNISSIDTLPHSLYYIAAALQVYEDGHFTEDFKEDKGIEKHPRIFLRMPLLMLFLVFSCSSKDTVC